MASTFQQLLEKLAPYVIVVGSFAKGTYKGTLYSDLDFYIRRRPQEELDKDLYGELPEHYTDTVQEIFEQNGIEFESLMIGHFGVKPTQQIPLLLEFYTMFLIPKDEKIFNLDVFGVTMKAAKDNKDIQLEDTIDYYHLTDV